MHKDLTAEFFTSNLPECEFSGPFVPGDATHKCKTSHEPVNRLAVVFAVYRSYKEYDYEDWQLERPSRSADLSKKVTAALLNSALRSLEYGQDRLNPTLWTRIKELIENFADKSAAYAKLVSFIGRPGSEAALPTGADVTINPNNSGYAYKNLAKRARFHAPSEQCWVEAS